MPRRPSKKDSPAKLASRMKRRWRVVLFRHLWGFLFCAPFAGTRPLRQKSFNGELARGKHKHETDPSYDRFRHINHVLGYIISRVNADRESHLGSARMDTGGEAEFLAEHYEEEGFRLPMTLVIIDQANNAARIAVTPSGTSWQ